MSYYHWEDEQYELNAKYDYIHELMAEHEDYAEIAYEQAEEARYWEWIDRGGWDEYEAQRLREERERENFKPQENEDDIPF